jgi:hypothetical protein
MKTSLLAAMLVAVALAGCAEAPPGDASPPGPGTAPLQAGMGAITGLLVDDRFRPIHLVADPQGEFQTTGFVLLQETGAQAVTNENGEFTFVNLEPGQYTLRVTAAGHEAIPQRVTVAAGQFAEESVIARRVASVGGTILTQEFAVFIPCAAYAIFDCTGDLSGDSFRGSFNHRFSDISGLTYMVTEALMNQDGVYCVEVREREATGGSTVSEHYGNWCTPSPHGDYIRGVNKVGEVYDTDYSRDPYDPDKNSQTVLFYFGPTEAVCWHDLTDRNDKRCIGAGAGIKAQFLLSLFIGEPDVDLDAYCVLC